jgi:predicted alpha/beta-hydrolase family hydrolase
MKHYAKLLSKFGPVRSFDYPSLAAGKKRPDPPAKLLESHRAELDAGRKIHGPRVVLVGKSMGGRMGCHLALEEDVLGVICLGYPLKGMGQAGKLRDQVLLDLPRPACFVQGTRDSLCPLDLMRETLKKRKAVSHLHIVQSGDHSLKATKTYLRTEGLTVEEQEAETMLAISAFLDTLD